MHAAINFDISTCNTCERELNEDGRCLYCTARKHLGMPKLPAQDGLSKPDLASVMTLQDLARSERFQLTAARMRIGSDPGNEIVVPAQAASRRHAIIIYENGRFWVQDLASWPGTKVNGSHVLDREALCRGDVLTVGDADFLVE